MTATQRDVSAEQARSAVEAARETEWRKPSFGETLFLGRLRMDLIDPRPQPTRTEDTTEFFASCATM